MSFKFTRFGYNLFGFFNQRFLIDMLYNRFITGLILKLGGHTTKILDKGSIELIGPFGLEKGLLLLSKNLASLDTGVVATYALYILTGLVFYLLIPFINLVDNSLLILIFFALFSVINTKGWVKTTQPLYQYRVANSFNRNRNFIRSMSTIAGKQLKLHPYFVTGFSDGESYYSISLSRSTNMSTGWIVNLQFGISLHKKDRYLLELIQAFFGGVGTIASHGKTKVQYRVSSIKDLEVIIQHFDSFPLITQKWSDFQLFKSAFELVSHKKHLTLEGLVNIVSIKASINLGLSDDLSRAFPKIIPSERPLVQSTKIIDPNWLSGFVSGEGNFFINVINSKTKVGKQVVLMFSISQHSRDASLLRSICVLLGCGVYYPRSNREEGNFTVAKFSDIEQKIIPFFKNYPLYGVKYLDYLDFCKAVEIIKVKEHLTEEGLVNIEKIQSGMNTKRVT
jgi:hypothetical protein